MNENIDLTKILKDCPKGTKLYSIIYGEIEFDRIEEKDIYSIIFTAENGSKVTVTSSGKHYDYFDGDCTLFPSKEQRDWSKFTASWYKKENDTINCLEKQGEQKKQVHFPKFTFDDILALQCCMETVKKVQEDKDLYNKLNLIHSKIYDAYWLGKQGEQEEHQVYKTEDGKIITYSETDGYKFVEPKFHKGQWIACKGLNTALIIDIIDNKYEVEFLDGNKGFPYIDYVDRRFHLWTIQDAKNGNVLAAPECYVVFKEIDGLNIKCYCTYHYLGFNPCLYRDTVQNKNAFLPATKKQHDALMKAMNNAGYEWNAKTKTLEKLVKPKFDPKTLQPFDKVIARNFNDQIWHADIFSHVETDEDGSYYNVIKDDNYLMVIPYNDETNHLVGTTEEAHEYYRYWEN